MKRRYTFKIYPNEAQAEEMHRQRRLHGALWNALLEHREMAWRRGVSMNFALQSREIKDLRRECPEFATVYSACLHATVKRMDLAFSAFFARCKKGDGGGYPRYRRVADYDVIGFKAHGLGWTMEKASAGPKSWHLSLYGVEGKIRMRGQFPRDPESIKTCEVMWRGDAWWLSVAVEFEDREPAARIGTPLTVRLDLIDQFATVEEAVEDGPRRSAPQGGKASQNQATLERQSQSDVESDAGCERCGGTTPDSAGSSQSDVESDAGCESPQHPGTPGQGRSQSDVESDAGCERLEIVRGDARGESQSDVESDASPEKPEDWCRTLMEIGTRIDEIKSKRDRCKRGSKRHRLLTRMATRLSMKQANVRSNALHVWTTSLVRRSSDLTVVSPPVRQATETARGDDRSHGAAVSTVAKINRHILSQAPATAVAMLTYKAAEVGIRCDVITSADMEVATLGSDISKAKKSARIARHTTKRIENDRFSVAAE